MISDNILEPNFATKTYLMYTFLADNDFQRFKIK